MDNKLLKTKIDEKTGIEYRLVGDYYIPNIVAQKQEKITLNKYGRMRLEFLKEHIYYNAYEWNIKCTFERNTINSRKKSKFYN